MSRIKGFDTNLEVTVRSFLFRHGFRFRKNVKTMPGKPDIVLSKYKTAIFVNGCFWHRHNNCRLATTPKTRTDFWLAKFEKNIRNDAVNTRKLEENGWRVITIWECNLKNNFEETMGKVISLLKSYK